MRTCLWQWFVKDHSQSYFSFSFSECSLLILITLLLCFFSFSVKERTETATRRTIRTTARCVSREVRSFCVTPAPGPITSCVSSLSWRRPLRVDGVVLTAWVNFTCLLHCSTKYCCKKPGDSFFYVNEITTLTLKPNVQNVSKKEHCFY